METRISRLEMYIFSLEIKLTIRPDKPRQPNKTASLPDLSGLTGSLLQFVYLNGEMRMLVPYFIKSLRRSTKLLLRYFSRTILFSASSSGVP